VDGLDDHIEKERRGWREGGGGEGGGGSERERNSKFAVKFGCLVVNA
jgi:hypothetical protein